MDQTKLTKEQKLISISDFLEKNGLMELRDNTINVMYNDINSIEDSEYLEDVEIYCRENINDCIVTEDEIRRMCKYLDYKYDSNLSLWYNIELAYDDL